MCLFYFLYQKPIFLYIDNISPQGGERGEIDRLKNVCYIFHKKGKKTSLIIIRPVDRGEGLLYVV